MFLFYHATEIGNAASQYGERLRWSVLADKIKGIVSEKVNYRGTQSKICVVNERSAKSGEMVSGSRRQPRFPPKPNYYFLVQLCSLKFSCKFLPWYLHLVDKLTSKKYAKTINIRCAANKVFLKYLAQWGVNPTHLLAYALVFD